MTHTKTKKHGRERRENLPARTATVARLRDYIAGQRIRPIMTDVVSDAVDKWIDAREQEA